MNKLIYIFLLICFTLFSCDDWLDVTSNTEIKGESQFSHEDGFKDALIGAYIAMTDKNLYSKNMSWHLVDVLAQPYNPLSVSSDYSLVQAYSYSHPWVKKTIDNIWKKQYNAICNINNALKYIDTNRDVLDDINYSIIKGELLGLRAFLHFDLLRLWGYGDLNNRSDLNSAYALPYQLKASKEIPEQLTYSDFFNVLVKDINDAAELLKEDPVVSGKGADYYSTVNIKGFYNHRENRLNYYALKALQARVYMWFGGKENYGEAKECAQEVIDNSFAKLIDTDVHDFEIDHRLYKEHLFNLDITDYNSIVASFFDASSIDNQEALYFTPNVIEDLYETDNENIGIVDIRFTKLLKNDILGKVQDKIRTQKGFLYRNIQPLIKLSEMYYILAECNANKESPNLMLAIESLNIVREHRGILEPIPETATKEEVLEEITKEYRKEFICEGQLFYYYKRTGKTQIKLATGFREVNDNDYVLPIPDSEIEIGNRE